MLEYLYGKRFGSSQNFSHRNKEINNSEESIQHSEHGESLKSRKIRHSPNDCNFLGKIIREYKCLTDIADEGFNGRPWSCWLRNFEFCKANGFIIQQVQYRNDVRNMDIVRWRQVA